MKKKILKMLVCPALTVALMLGACSKASASGNKEGGTASTPASGSTTASGSTAGATANPSGSENIAYAFGMYYGNNLKQNLEQFGLKTIDYKEFMKGFQDLVDGKTTRMTEQQAMDTLNTAVQAAQTAMASENKKAGDAFLAENAKKPGVVTTTSGLQYQVISKGDGPKPKSTDTVNVKYEGTLLDGTVFDTTKDAKSGTDTDRQIPLDQVIKGWTEGIQLMNVGSTYKFYIPAELAYGEQSPGGAIKPNSTLIFTVTLDSILPPVSTTSGSSK